MNAAIRSASRSLTDKKTKHRGIESSATVSFILPVD
jgi:hypothetical protein